MARGIKMLVVGLGNPPMPNTRHSIGMTVLEAVAKRLQLSWRHCRHCNGKLAHALTGNDHLYLLKPKYLMNINGKSVKTAMQHLSVPLQNVVIIHDDIDRPIGKLSLKLNGSAGGHNGVRSVISCLKSDEFRRLRFGIGRPTNKSDVTDYVLSEFNDDEKEKVKISIDECMRIVLDMFEANCKDVNDSSPKQK